VNTEITDVTNLNGWVLFDVLRDQWDVVHDHRFVETSFGTEMFDRFEFESPFGILGWLVERVFLGRYLRRFLVERNRQLRELAETDGWRKYLSPSNKTNLPPL
jgi:ligand-binding SRPBCC domain-containing protein